VRAEGSGGCAGPVFLRREHHRGFSTVELLVVLALIGVTTAIGLLGAGEVVARWRLDSVSRDIASALKAARARAILERTQVTMPFDAARRLYVLTSSGVSTGMTKEGGVAVTRLPERISFCSPDGSTAITFAPPATPSETVALFDTAGLLRSNNLPSDVHVCDATIAEYRRIRVSPVGTIRLDRWTGTAWQ